MLKSLIVKKLKKTTNKTQLNLILNFINFFLFGRNTITKKSVKYLDLYSSKKCKLMDQVKTKIFLPVYEGFKWNDFIEINAPEVQIVELNDFIVSGCSSSFIKDKDIYIERFCNVENNNALYDSGGVLTHDNDCALAQLKNLNFIDEGFFLGGNGSWNYYHWLIEIIPKLRFYIEMGLHKKGVKLLVPEILKANQNLKFLLDSVLGDQKVTLIYISRYFSLQVGCLYHVTPINNILFNEREVGLTTNILHLRYESLEYIRTRMASAISLNKEHFFYTERVFLARKESSSRGYNQDEVITYLKKHDFTVVYMEEHDVAQQIFLFKHAKVLIGPSGAAWTNLIFCNKRCKALTWLPESIKDFPAFSSLAKFSGVELTFFNTASENSTSIHDNYLVDIELLGRNLKRLLGNNSAHKGDGFESSKL